ncbi:hypothetical protein DNTS_024204 [Danionella cerebrum]|uniref:Uncharacterized protein n=1 Tax=Danionella cerebrum TaxID=2873325 RepID=A0A553RL57_9TELE|nr:hypothetical protein DNTS_024204 [Danionella translucida]
MRRCRRPAVSLMKLSFRGLKNRVCQSLLKGRLPHNGLPIVSASNLLLRFSPLALCGPDFPSESMLPADSSFILSLIRPNRKTQGGHSRLQTLPTFYRLCEVSSMERAGEAMKRVRGGSRANCTSYWTAGIRRVPSRERVCPPSDDWELDRNTECDWERSVTHVQINAHL